MSTYAPSWAIVEGGVPPPPGGRISVRSWTYASAAINFSLFFTPSQTPVIGVDLGVGFNGGKVSVKGLKQGLSEVFSDSDRKPKRRIGSYVMGLGIVVGLG